MILEAVSNDINSPLPFSLNEWKPLHLCYKRFFQAIKDDDKLYKGFSNEEKAFIDRQAKNDINEKNFKIFRVTILLALEGRWDEIDDSQVEGKHKIASNIFSKSKKYESKLIPDSEIEGWNIKMDTSKLNRPEDIAKNYKLLLYLNSKGEEVVIDSKKKLRELDEKYTSVIKDNSTIESIKKEMGDKKEEKVDTKEEDIKIEDPKEEAEFKSSETFGSISLPKGFFNNFADPNIEDIKIKGKTAIEVIKEDLLSKKDKIKKLNNIKIYVSSNGLRNTSLAEKLSFKELNDNRIQKVKDVVNKVIEEVKNEVNVGEINFEVVKDWKVSGTKLIKGEFTPNNSLLVGPPTPYEKMIDINGGYFDYYKSLGKTLNTKTGLEGTNPIGLIMERKGNSITGDLKLLPKNNYTIKDGMVTNAIFILEKTKITKDTLKTLLPKCEVIMIDASVKEDGKKEEIASKIFGKQVLVNMSTIYGVAGAISKVYEPLNTLKIEWSYNPSSSEKKEEEPTKPGKKEEEKPSKEEKKSYVFEFKIEITDDCVVDCDISIN